MPSAALIRPCLVLALAAPWLAGCAGSALTDRECMTRVMYFESNRSSSEGMLAVGTTVMNRLDSPKYPKSVCDVVGQRSQFAPGVLDRPMNPREAALPARMADKVLAGERHPGMSADAMFFHTAGLTFPYGNMHYVLIAGGNAFYEKRSGPNQGTYAAAEEAALAHYSPRAPAASPRRDREVASRVPPDAVDAAEPAGGAQGPDGEAPPEGGEGTPDGE